MTWCVPCAEGYFRSFPNEFDFCQHCPQCFATSTAHEEQCLGCALSYSQERERNTNEMSQTTCSTLTSGYLACSNSIYNSTFCHNCTQIFLRGYKKPDLCMPCDHSCETCVGDGEMCVTCASGYFRNAGTVLGRCWECSKRCATCVPGLYLSCLACAPGYYFRGDIHASHCLRCESECTQCKSFSDGCLECAAGYYDTSLLDHSCHLCEEYIKRLLMTIEQCHYLIGQEKPKHLRLCSQAVEKCASCNDADYAPALYHDMPVCHPCKRRLAICEKLIITCQQRLHNTNASTVVNELESLRRETLRCSKCGFLSFVWSDTLFKCQKCIKPCKTCAGSGQCLSCIPGFYMAENGTCLPCGPFCLVCEDQFNCVTCQDGFYQSSESESQLCLPCDKSCATCNGIANNCLRCADGYCQEANNKTKHCQKCDKSHATCEDGFYQSNELDSQSCLPCDKSCAACNGTATNCLYCADGYYQQTSNKLRYYQSCDICREHPDFCGVCAPTHLNVSLPMFSARMKCLNSSVPAALITSRSSYDADNGLTTIRQWDTSCQNCGSLDTSLDTSASPSCKY